MQIPVYTRFNGKVGTGYLSNEYKTDGLASFDLLTFFIKRYISRDVRHDGGHYD